MVTLRVVVHRWAGNSSDKVDAPWAGSREALCLSPAMVPLSHSHEASERRMRSYHEGRPSINGG